MTETSSEQAGPAVDWNQQRYSISQVAQRCGLSPHTLRWYERIGLMDYVDRDHAGQRRFSDRDLDWLALIGRLRATGMSVSDMVGYAQLVRAGEDTFPERLAMFRRTRDEVLAKIAELQATLVVLDGKIATYEGTTPGGSPACSTPEGKKQP